MRIYKPVFLFVGDSAGSEPGTRQRINHVHRVMLRRRLLSCLVVGMGLATANVDGQVAQSPAASAQTTQLDYPLNRFEKDIREFEKQDSLHGKSTGKIVFIGSSSFAYWQTITTDLAPLPVLNRGFGGSTLPEVNYYADRILFPYQPKTIVVYAGENDLNVGDHPQTPEQVLTSFRTLVSSVHRRLPQTLIYFVSMKPSPSRWAKWPVTQRANQLIEAFIKTDKRLRFIDIRPAMLGANGRPRPDLFRPDSLHMNAKGYAIWAGALKLVLAQ